MSDAVLIKELVELLPYANKDNIVEIVVRGANKRFKAFQKVALADLQQNEGKELVEKAIHALNQGNQANVKNMEVLQNVAQAQNLGLVLNGLNLCATCAGFAIMYEKLDKMSAEINRQIGKLQSAVKQGHEVQAGFEFNKVLADYQDMLDSRRTQQPYDQAAMRKLVDREYNVLMLLISVLQNDLASNKKMMLDSIFSMLAMLTVSLRYFDEQYYFKNHEVLGATEAWHTSHEKWMSVYDILSATWFVELLQDYGMFEAGFSTVETDVYYNALIAQVADLRQEIKDNQFLIISVGDPKLLRSLHEVTTKNVRDTIESAINYAFAGSEFEGMEEVRRNVLAQVAVA